MAEQGSLSNQRLGDKYLLGTLLGQGGFGVVYQARHILLNRQQAIKILLEQHFTSPKFRERFLREAQTLAALDHPNIVHVDDFGVEGNRAYLVMPYIGGGNLHRLLRREPLPLLVAAEYLEDICEALDYAHARNVAHLDLKPLNLLLHEDGRLLLSDFGLAHLMEQGAIEGSTSLQFGTPTYMAPEHLQGQPERRSDLYALGIILYQMLTGRVPFEGSNAAAIMLKHLTEPPPPLHTLRPDLPLGLDGVFSKALAKRAEDRYQSADALLAAFKAALGGSANLSEAGIANAPTRLSPAPLATTIRAAKPLSALEGEEATLRGAFGPKALAPVPRKKAPGGLLSRKSIQRLSLSTIVSLLLGVGLSILYLDVVSVAITSGVHWIEDISNVLGFLGLLLGLLTWFLGLFRTAKMKSWGWFVTIFLSLPVAFLLLLLGDDLGGPLGLVFAVYPGSSLLVPLTTFVYSRRS